MSIHYTQQNGPRPTLFVVRCTPCGRNVPDGVDKFPYNRNTVVARPLCGELRHYRPSEVFIGGLDGVVEERKASPRFRPFVGKPSRRGSDSWE